MLPVPAPPQRAELTFADPLDRVLWWSDVAVDSASNELTYIAIKGRWYSFELMLPERDDVGFSALHVHPKLLFHGQDRAVESMQREPIDCKVVSMTEKKMVLKVLFHVTTHQKDSMPFSLSVFLQHRAHALCWEGSAGPITVFSKASTYRKQRQKREQLHGLVKSESDAAVGEKRARAHDASERKVRSLRVSTGKGYGESGVAGTCKGNPPGHVSQGAGRTDGCDLRGGSAREEATKLLEADMPPWAERICACFENIVGHMNALGRRMDRYDDELAAVKRRRVEAPMSPGEWEEQLASVAQRYTRMPAKERDQRLRGAIRGSDVEGITDLTRDLMRVLCVKHEAAPPGAAVGISQSEVDTDEESAPQQLPRTFSLHADESETLSADDDDDDDDDGAEDDDDERNGGPVEQVLREIESNGTDAVQPLSPSALFPLDRSWERAVHSEWWNEGDA